MMTITTTATTARIGAREKSVNRPAPVSIATILERSHQATEMLKAMAHESRLAILCLLYQGEKSVTELESILELRQPTISQQLARLRTDNLVKTRRDGKMIYYSIASEEAERVVELLCDLYVTID